MAVDGELSAHRLTAFRAHLAYCWSCRARMNEIEGAIADFRHLHHSELDSKLPPVSGSRALLRARLAALAAGSEMNFAARLLRRSRLWRSYQFASVVLFVALIAALAVRLGSPGNPAGSKVLLEAAAVPRPQLTPGATISVTRQQVCDTSSLTQGPVIPASLQQQVFTEYGITDPRPGAYEIDYLITPDLGGAANIRNLWPEPYFSTVWNARVKDQLEERLHAMVCSGELDLARAQHDLATDWVGAYKKYFHTDRPKSGAGNETRQWNRSS